MDNVLKTVTNYFTDKQSNVYIASLDASEAFDKLNHHKLFAMMIDKQVPITFIDIIVNWYSKLFLSVFVGITLILHWYTLHLVFDKVKFCHLYYLTFTLINRFFVLNSLIWVVICQIAMFDVYYMPLILCFYQPLSRYFSGCWI